MSTATSTTRQSPDDGTPLISGIHSYMLRLSSSAVTPMSMLPTDAPGALQDPLQRQLALDLAARFNPTSHSSFVPQSLIGMTGFPLYSPGDPASLISGPSPPPAAAIYQEYSREEPQNRGYDVDVGRFLRHWSRDSQYLRAKGDTVGSLISADVEHLRLTPRSAHIRASELKGDGYDMQGFDWASLGTTRASARAVRSRYCEAVHMEPAATPVSSSKLTAPGVDLFRFRRMNTRHRAWIAHFQLRNALAVSSATDIFYLSKDKVHRTDPLGGTGPVVMDMSDVGAHLNGTSGFGNSAIAASSEVLVTGSKHGQYAMTSLTARRGSRTIVNEVNSKDAAICHVELFRRRGQYRRTTAAFASNDETVRLLDCSTNKFVSRFSYGFAINCTSSDPNGQMRLVAGDSKTAYVTAADSGAILCELSQHTANIHATSWSSDGLHLATGAEDQRVLIYDARNWAQPIAEITCETACPRSLKFSPISAPSPSLLIAEAEDVVSVIDMTAGLARKDSRQVLDFFGAIAGIDWRPDGRAFWVANADAHFGGLMEFERNSAVFSESDAVGSRVEARNEASRAVQHARDVTARQTALNQRKRSSWQMSSGGLECAGEEEPVAVLGKKRSLHFAPGMQQDRASRADAARSDESTSPQQRYIQRVQRTRTRGMPSRGRQGLGRLLNP